MVEGLNGGEIISFALALAAELFGSHRKGPPASQIGGARRFPEGMIMGHRDSPISHRAVRIGLNDGGKGALRFLIPEGMKQGDAPVKGFLDCFFTGDRKRGLADYFGGRGRFFSFLLRFGDRCGEEGDQNDKKKKGVTFHSILCIQRSFECRSKGVIKPVHSGPRGRG